MDYINIQKTFPVGLTATDISLLQEAIFTRKAMLEQHGEYGEAKKYDHLVHLMNLAHHFVFIEEEKEQ